jgi:4-amino-4-deoxy-L-arabinose transferase-like glycosyltransferase
LNPRDPASPSRPRRPNRAVFLALGGVLAAGIAVRAVHFASIADTAFPRLPEVFPESDMHITLSWARRIPGDVLGREAYHPYTEWMRRLAPPETWHVWWGGKEIFQQTPLYPYFVAGLLEIFRGSLEAVLAVQLGLGALQPLVVFFLGRRIAGPWAGVVAAALTALHGTTVFYQGAMLRDWLLPILEPLAILFVLRGDEADRKRDWLAAGAVFGLAMLAKETVTLLLAVACLWVVWRGRSALGRAALRVALVVLGFAAMVSPLVVRNAVVGAPLLAVSNRKPEAFVQANAADAEPIGMYVPPSMKGILERSRGSSLAVVRNTLATYEGDWGAFLGMQLHKLRGIVDPMEVPNNLSFAYGRTISPVLGWMIPYGVLFPLGLAGLCVAGLAAPRRARSLLMLYFLASVTALVAAIVLARYRLVLVPILAIYAAMGLLSAGRDLGGRKFLLPSVYLGLVVMFAALQILLVPIRELRARPFYTLFPAAYMTSARLYVTEGRYDRAVAEIARLRDRARALARAAGDDRESAAAHEKVAALAMPMLASLRVEWAEALLREEKRDEARREAELAVETFGGRVDVAETCYHLGLVYEALGEGATARSFFGRFLELAPSDPRARTIRQKIDG